MYTASSRGYHIRSSSLRLINLLVKIEVFIVEFITWFLENLVNRLLSVLYVLWFHVFFYFLCFLVDDFTLLDTLIHATSIFYIFLIVKSLCHWLHAWLLIKRTKFVCVIEIWKSSIVLTVEIILIFVSSLSRHWPSIDEWKWTIRGFTEHCGGLMCSITSVRVCSCRWFGLMCLTFSKFPIYIHGLYRRSTVTLSIISIVDGCK